MATFWTTYNHYSQAMHELIHHLEWMRFVKSLHHDRQRVVIREFRDHAHQFYLSSSRYQVGVQLMFNVLTVIALLSGIILIRYSQLTVGAFGLFFFYMMLGKPYLSLILGSVPVMHEGYQAARSIFEFFERRDVAQRLGSEPIVFRGGVTLTDVSFSHGANLVFNRISIMISPGDIVVISGPNGSGKSTLFELILGLRQPDSGTIQLDGRALDRLALDGVYSQLAMVHQKPRLLPRSIRDNFLAVCPDATDDEILAVCRVVGLDASIPMLAQELDRPLGENNQLLSGGQVQRLAIARALITRPKLMILDEPTNHLDSTAIETLVDAIYRYLDHPTILISSHHPTIVTRPHRRLEVGAGLLHEVS